MKIISTVFTQFLSIAARSDPGRFLEAYNWYVKAISYPWNQDIEDEMVLSFTLSECFYDLFKEAIRGQEMGFIQEVIMVAAEFNLLTDIFYFAAEGKNIELMELLWKFAKAKDRVQDLFLEKELCATKSTGEEKENTLNVFIDRVASGDLDIVKKIWEYASESEVVNYLKPYLKVAFCLAVANRDLNMLDVLFDYAKTLKMESEVLTSSYHGNTPLREAQDSIDKEIQQKIKDFVGSLDIDEGQLLGDISESSLDSE